MENHKTVDCGDVLIQIPLFYRSEDQEGEVTSQGHIFFTFATLNKAEIE